MNEVSTQLVQSDPLALWSIAIAAASAFFAAIAAGISFWQTHVVRDQGIRDERAAKVLRTFDHTAAASTHFAECRQSLGNAFGDWNNARQIPADQVAAAFKSDHTLLSSFNFVLNHYGRMATAYEYEVIDRKVAKELFGFGFIRFWFAFKPYLDAQFGAKPSLRRAYDHSNRLYSIWSHELWDQDE